MRTNPSQESDNGRSSICPRPIAGEPIILRMSRQHRYTVTVEWTGNKGEGTSSYRTYDRAHSIHAPGKASIEGSSDPAFRGDKTRYNPEELLVAALSSCHMLWFLHQCADAGIVVESYVDEPIGMMQETADGGGKFTSVVLKPAVGVRGEVDPSRIDALHEKAHQLCFIANSVNFPVTFQATTHTAQTA